MVKIEIGLYKNKETGDYDVMIDCIDNVMKVHSGEFDKIASFTHIHDPKQELLDWAATIICNVGEGDNTNQSKEWIKGSINWIDNYNRIKSKEDSDG